MTKMGFLRLSYEKQDTLLKLLILSMAAILCKRLQISLHPSRWSCMSINVLCFFGPFLSSILHQTVLRPSVWKRHPWVWSVSTAMRTLVRLLYGHSSFNLQSWFLNCRYFNYRTTRFLTEEGFYKFHNWFDDRAWYPLGRIIGGTIYPGTVKCCLFQNWKTRT